MPEYVLRIEPTNLHWFLGDTDDLATMRGGSILLLDLPKTLCDEFHPSERGKYLTVDSTMLTILSAGASEFVVCFQVDAVQVDSCIDKAYAITKSLKKYITGHEALRFATFGFSLQSIPCESNNASDFQKKNEQTKMELRRKQLQYASASVARSHGESTSKIAKLYCNLDGKRPAVRDMTGSASASDKNFASDASFVRRELGRESKVSWGQFTPAWTLEEVASLESRFIPSDSDQRSLFGQLSGKIAVLYADGNKFGSLVRSLARDPMTLAKLDREMRDKRCTLETVVGDWIEGHDHWRCVARDESGKLSEKRRVQTLLWGGDELIWVAPAWAGLELAQLFFRMTEQWELNGHQLTHAAGLVFCSHKAPIRDVVELAKQLAETVKSSRNDLVKVLSLDDPPENVERSPHANALGYVVLESFDHLGRDFDLARKAQRFRCLNELDEVLTAAELSRLVLHLNKMKKLLPNRRLHQIAQCMYMQDTPNSFETLFKRICKTSGSVKLEHLKTAVRRNGKGGSTDQDVMAAWQHMSNLWNYCFESSDVASDPFFHETASNR